MRRRQSQWAGESAVRRNLRRLEEGPISHGGGAHITRISAPDQKPETFTPSQTVARLLADAERQGMKVSEIITTTPTQEENQ